MTKGNKTVSRFRTLADTSSVVAHDLCAQLHVLQFCLEELNEHVDPQGKEFLKRMGASTNYITHLIDSFRRGLKVSLTDNEAHPLSDIYDGFIELIKNHYFIVLEKIKFDVEGNLANFTIKRNSRQLLHQFFALYSFYIDELRANQDEENANLNFCISVQKKNNRFVDVYLVIKGMVFDRESFDLKLEQSVEEKGKIRQFLGVTLIREALLEDKDFLTFQSEGQKNIIKITLPLEQNI